MYLKKLFLQNFRNYDKAEFEFDKETIIVGPNTSGKTNIMEAIYLLATGKSLRTDKDVQMLKFGAEVGRVKARLAEDSPRSDQVGAGGESRRGEVDGPPRVDEKTRVEAGKTLEVVLTAGEVGGERAPAKKYLINNVSKKRVDFAGNLFVVSFSPLDLEIIIGTPSIRRNFLDEVLEQIDFDYRVSLTEYIKGIRQRNSLLELTRKTGQRDVKQFEYWDNLVIRHGNVVTQKREELIADFNKEKKEIFDFAIVYGRSIISYERLLEYQEEEFLAGVTLVGPHRDDVIFEMYDEETRTAKNIKFFGSRGQQRLTVLQLKVLQLLYFERKKQENPVLLLDDIFSELDERHIKHVLQILSGRETVFTTTHMEFVPEEIAERMKVITLSKA